MPNVIRMPGKPARATASATPDRTIDPEAAKYIASLHAMAKGRIQLTLSLLEATVANIRDLSATISNPDIRSVVERELATLDGALGVARGRTLEL